MNKVTVSAPGKLMLFGEHAVVYGYPCIVTAVDKRLAVSVETSKKEVLITPGVKKSLFVEKALTEFRKKYSVSQKLQVVTNGDFSHDVGLGSSSAVSVAAIKALCELFAIKLSPKELFDICYEIILSIQGVGSGFDVAAAIWGRTIFFKKGGEVVELLPTVSLPLVIGYSGIKADTAAIVKNVSEDYRKNQKLKKVFSSIGNLVVQAKIEIENEDFKKLGLLMTENHKLLKQLGVSTGKLDAMVEAAVNAGAWGAKLSGAGGGDCMIAVAAENKRSTIEKAIQKVGGEIIAINTGAEGVKVER